MLSSMHLPLPLGRCVALARAQRARPTVLVNSCLAAYRAKLLVLRRSKSIPKTGKACPSLINIAATKAVTELAQQVKRQEAECNKRKAAQIKLEAARSNLICQNAFLACLPLSQAEVMRSKPSLRCFETPIAFRKQYTIKPAEPKEEANEEFTSWAWESMMMTKSLGREKHAQSCDVFSWNLSSPPVFNCTQQGLMVSLPPHSPDQPIMIDLPSLRKRLTLFHYERIKRSVCRPASKQTSSYYRVKLAWKAGSNSWTSRGLKRSMVRLSRKMGLFSMPSMDLL